MGGVQSQPGGGGVSPWGGWGGNQGPSPTIDNSWIPTNYPSPDVNTASTPAAVYAAQATAYTSNDRHNYVQGKVFDRYISIWLENTDFAKAEADPNLAWLASKGLTLSNMFGVTHPSEPNYVAAVGGDNFGMDNDQFNQIDFNVSSVIDLLEDKGISWGTYQEDMPYTGYEGFNWLNQETHANDYVRKHNPPMIYNRNTSPRRLSYQKNTTEFFLDLANDNLPQWIFFTPNMTSDAHDSSVTVAGSYVRGLLEPLLDNEYFMERTLILVTFDENHTYSLGNRVFSFLLGGAVPQNLVGTTDDSFYNHYSEIATVEANWNLHTLGRWDVGANVYSFVGEQTGDVIRANDAATGANPTYFYNSSFAGPFNADFKTAAYPIPNVFLTSPNTGRTVLPCIAEQYYDLQGSAQNYYTDSVVVPDGAHPPAGYAANP